MKVVKTFLFAVLPFVIFSAYQSLSAPFSADEPQSMRLISASFLAASAVLVFLQIILRDGLCFPAAVMTVLAALTASVFIIPSGSYAVTVSSHTFLRAVLTNPMVALYSVLFFAAFVPQLAGLEPFTVYFAKQTTDRAFWKTKLFRAVNVRISYFWAALFLVCLAVQALPWPAARIALPFAVQLCIGAPGTKWLIPFLLRRLSYVERDVPRRLSSVRESLMGIPIIYDRSAVKNMNSVFQFHITGYESLDCYLAVEKGVCTFHDGTHLSPSVEIISPSDVWLKISNGELDGASALLSQQYEVKGDMSLLMVFSRMTGRASGEKESSIYRNHELRDSTTWKFSRVPSPVRRVVAVIGSPRGEGVSKSELLAESFLEGCREAGAVTEVIHLREKKIEHCIGCYTCWTKTPGVCIFSDDAADLYKKEFSADLVVYAFPLYHFGINSLLKKYIERSLPAFQPHLVEAGDHVTGHHVREQYRKNRYTVIIGAAGFPERSHFSAASANFRALASMADTAECGLKIVAELYRPAAEALGIPYYAKENGRVLDLMQEAGRQAVRSGMIDPSVADEVSQIRFDKKRFNAEANMSWDLCIEEGKTLAQFQRELTARQGQGTEA
jgi:multimeric flavodoxin WrbA/putative sterol carrier protein